MTDLDCQVCGRSEPDVYSVATGEGDRPAHLEHFSLCAGCASALVDEIAANIPDRYLDGVAHVVRRRAERREELAR